MSNREEYREQRRQEVRASERAVGAQLRELQGREPDRLVPIDKASTEDHFRAIRGEGVVFVEAEETA